MIAGVENPLVVYMRKDTPPGLKVAADIMKAKDFKALSLSVQNSNTINQALSLDLLGIKYQAVPAYRGLKEVETAILQNIGQLANSSLLGLARLGRADHGRHRHPAVAAGAARQGRQLSAQPGAARYADLRGVLRDGPRRQEAVGHVRTRCCARRSDPLLAMFRTALMPPKTPDEPVAVMRSAFVELWKDPQFIRDYSNVVKTEPILVSGREGQDILAALGRVKPEIKAFIIDYADRLAAK